MDTIGLNDKTWLDDVGLPHGQALRVLERYELVDPEHLRVNVTVTDPETFTAPWHMQLTFKRRPDLRLKEDPCSEKLWHPEPSDVNLAQPDGTTALHWAAYHGDIAAAAALLRARAKPGALREPA